jgi:hypothetical protein
MTPRVAIHIGYRKTASTWFQEVALPRHPRIRRFVAVNPNQDPFLRYILPTPDRSFDPAVAGRLFDERVAELGAGPDDLVMVSAERLSGHAATGGYDSVRIATRLAAVVPEARVFWVVREQVSMLESEYRQLVREGTPAPLDAFLHVPPRFTKRVGFDLSHYEYDLLADRYAEQFGRDNIRLFDLRNVASDPRGFLDELAPFLGLDPWPPIPPAVLRQRVNPGLPRRLMNLQRFMNHFRRGWLNPYPLIALKSVWREPISRVASRLPPPKRPFFDAETHQWLQDRFATSNARLFDRYGIDLR